MATRAELEVRTQDEDKIVKEMISQTVSQMQPISGCVRRGQHAKTTGCVAAEFRVVDNVPRELRCGIFAQSGRAFEALVRFSNSQGTLEADPKGTGRGMAIKLLDVDGDRAIGDDLDRSQDFLLINFSSFPFPDPRRYLDLIKRRNVPVRGGMLAFLHLTIAEREEFGIVMAIKNTRISSPLDATYWSGSPYWLGTADGSEGRAVKYSVVPRGRAEPKEAEPADLGPDYLTVALKDRLAAGPVVFDFKVQIQTDPVKMPIEDASKVWDETISVPISVATLTVRSQAAEVLDENMKNCEALAFSPWHALAAHYPLGGINRLRRAVYEESFLHRIS